MDNSGEKAGRRHHRCPSVLFQLKLYPSLVPYGAPFYCGQLYDGPSDAIVHFFFILFSNKNDRIPEIPQNFQVLFSDYRVSCFAQVKQTKKGEGQMGPSP
jgi:hypothetical protein